MAGLEESKKQLPMTGSPMRYKSLQIWSHPLFGALVHTSLLSSTPLSLLSLSPSRTQVGYLRRVPLIHQSLPLATSPSKPSQVNPIPLYYPNPGLLSNHFRLIPH